MKKRMTTFATKSAKSALAVTLAATMAVPTAMAAPAVKVLADEASVEVTIPEPVKTLDFNKGLKEYIDDEDLYLEIVKTENVLVQKTEEEKETSDRFDANNMLIMSTGKGAYYMKYTISNQPTTYYDAERGTVLYMGKTVTLPAVVKAQSAAIPDDADATATLDKAVPVPDTEDKIVQPEMTIASELKMQNPFSLGTVSDEDGTTTTSYDGVEQPEWKDGVTVTYWIKAPTDEEGKYISGSVLSVKPYDTDSSYGEFQIDDDNSVMWTADDPSVEDDNDGNEFYMNSWKSATGAAVETTGEAVTPAAVAYEDASSYADSPVSANNTANENAGKWHQVAVTVQNDWVEFYLDGKCVDVKSTYGTLGSDKIGFEGSFKGFNYGTGLRYGFGSATGSTMNSESQAALLTSWLCDGSNELHIGGSSAMASAFGLAENSAAIMLDDLTFYDQVLTSDQVSAIYTRDTQEETPVATVYGVSKDLTTMDGAEKEITTSVETVNGQTRTVVAVPENTKSSKKNGAILSSNPFAGKNLNGATISYWTKQDPRTGVDNSATMASVSVAFMDTAKRIVHEKSDVDDEAFSLLSVKSDGNSVFKEGFSNEGVGNKLKNTYTYRLSTEDQSTYNVNDWYYVTVVMNNGGTKVYVNGQSFENSAFDDSGKSIAGGARFCDGYYLRANDEQDVKTKYNIFGGSNNQFATSLIGFLEYEDTNVFFGYMPQTAMANEKTNPTYYTGIRTFDMCLSDEQVAALYANNAVYDAEGTVDPDVVEKPAYESGDADLNGKVELNDAQLVLKAALGITTLTGDAFAAADVDANGKIELTDAQNVLKMALGIK